MQTAAAKQPAAPTPCVWRTSPSCALHLSVVVCLLAACPACTTPPQILWSGARSQQTLQGRSISPRSRFCSGAMPRLPGMAPAPFKWAQKTRSLSLSLITTPAGNRLHGVPGRCQDNLSKWATHSPYRENLQCASRHPIPVLHASKWIGTGSPARAQCLGHRLPEITDLPLRGPLRSTICLLDGLRLPHQATIHHQQLTTISAQNRQLGLKRRFLNSKTLNSVI